MNDCLFCKIVSGEIPCYKVYEDKHCLAFLDIRPLNPGHTLVIPKQHSKNILEIDEKTLQEIIIIVKRLSNKIKTVLQCDGINIMINNEPAAGQIVFHTHIHIIPRFKDDGLRQWEGNIQQTDGELKTTAKLINQ